MNIKTIQSITNIQEALKDFSAEIINKYDLIDVVFKNILEIENNSVPEKEPVLKSGDIEVSITGNKVYIRNPFNEEIKVFHSHAVQNGDSDIDWETVEL